VENTTSYVACEDDYLIWWQQQSNWDLLSPSEWLSTQA